MSDLADEVAAILKKMEPEITPLTDGYADAAILLASVFIGADEAKITEELGYEPEYVAQIGSRLRNAGIWDGGKNTEAEIYLHAEDGGMAFWLGASIASGEMTSFVENGERRYKISEAGQRRVQKLMRSKL